MRQKKREIHLRALHPRPEQGTGSGQHRQTMLRLGQGPMLELDLKLGQALVADACDVCDAWTGTCVRV
jgi:hypothetical protein